MIRTCLSTLLAVSAVSYPAAACEIGKGTILAIPSADNQHALLDVRVPAGGRAAQACFQIAPHCSWEWEPTQGFLDTIRGQQNPTVENCDARSSLVNDMDHERRLTCLLSSPVARPFVFAGQLLAALKDDQCFSTVVLPTTSHAVHAQAKLRSSSLEYCLDLQWSVSTKGLLVSFAPTCGSSEALEDAPTLPVRVRVAQPKAAITFDVKPSLGETWSLASVSALPSGTYLSRWVQAVRNSDLARLTPPEESPDSGTRQNAVTLPDLIGHWTLAMLLAGRSTDDDLPLRAWMSELELRNGDAAKNTLLRTECIEPTDISSCK